MGVRPPREHPLWLRLSLTLCGPLGLGFALLDVLNVAVGVLFAAIGVLYIVWEIYPSAHAFVRRRTALSLFVFLACGLVISFLLWLLLLKAPLIEGKQELFSAQVRSAFVSDSGLLTLFMVGYPSMFGNTASPVFYLADIRITNLQDVVSTLSDIRIAASKDQNGPWEDLPSIRLDTTTLYSLGSKTPYPKRLGMQRGTSRLATQMTKDDMKGAAVIKVSSTLESQIGKRIEPHASIRGWIALDSLRHVGLSPGRIYFRVEIGDTANKVGTVIAELPRKQPGDSSMDADVGWLEVTGRLTDISGHHARYYSDPYPRSEPKRP